MWALWSAALQEEQSGEVQEQEVKVRSLQQMNAELEAQLVKLAGQRRAPVGQGSR